MTLLLSVIFPPLGLFLQLVRLIDLNPKISDTKTIRGYIAVGIPGATRHNLVRSLPELPAQTQDIPAFSTAFHERFRRQASWPVIALRLPVAQNLQKSLLL
jgi:hypothetical protein